MQCMPYSAVAARDLNASRFAAAKTIIYGPDGATDAAARDAGFGMGRVRRADVLPQLYMGEEVDAWPEMSSREYQDGVIYYGDGLEYPWPNAQNCIQEKGLPVCRSIYSTEYTPNDHSSYGVLDEQGYPIEITVSDIQPIEIVPSDFQLYSGHNPSKSRQHLVYFPISSKLSAEGWVASDSGPFGGASKRLQTVLNEIQAGGFAFLAHPLDSRKPGTGLGGTAGPDVVPYSDIALHRAWSSPAILGLQFWNEDNRYHSDHSATSLVKDKRGEGENSQSRFTLEQPYQSPRSPFFTRFPWRWEADADVSYEFRKLYHGASTWDRFLRIGLNPAETAPLTWLPKGEPRKWFMAGGSDAHGDLNYRQVGEMCASRWCTSGIVDTAIGKPRNLVLVSETPAGPPVPALPSATRYTNRQVIDALRAGQFSVTDGPAVRIAIDKNRNGKIEDTDFQMGSTFNLFPGEKIPLLVEWMSSPEFGPIQEVDVYVGTPSEIFAPKDHGPLASGIAYAYGNTFSNPDTGAYSDDPSGVLRVFFAEGTYVPGTPLPLVDPKRYHGVAQLHLNPTQFGLAGSDQLLFYIRAFARTVDAFARSKYKDGELIDPNVLNDISLRRCASSSRDAGSGCGFRLAYSNPVWGRYQVSCSGRPTSSALDGDNNGVPDTCERDIPDPCPAVAPRGGHRLDAMIPLGPEGRPPVAVDPSRTPVDPLPEKTVQGTSCQIVKSLVFSLPGGAPGVFEGPRRPN